MTRIGTPLRPSTGPETASTANNGPGGAKEAETTASTAASTAAGGEAGSPALEGGRVVDGFDGFDGTQQRGMGTPTDPRLAAASERFTSRLEDVLNRDALSLSRGEQPWQEGQPLSEQQQRELRGAAKDYLMDVPLGAFAPGVKDGVGALLDRAGARPDNLDSMTLRDVQRHVGDAASDFAEGLVDQVKDKAPAAYYGILGAGAVAAGGLAYTQGSDALRRLGVKPEAKLGLFHKTIELRAGAEWDARFRNFEPNLGVRGHVSGDNYAFNGDVRFDRHGVTDARLSGHYDFSSSTRLLGSVEYQPVRSLRDPNPNLSLDDGAYDDRLRASVSLVHRPSDRSTFAITGSYDNVTGPWVGVGFTARF